MLAKAKKGGTFLLAAPYGKDEIWSKIPVEVQQQIIDKNLKFYVIDAPKIAEEAGLPGRTNVIIQTAFFLISGVLPEERALELIKKATVKTYGKKGQDIVDRNINAIEAARTRIEKVEYPKQTAGDFHTIASVPDSAPVFVREVTGEIIGSRGEVIPVSKLPDDGTYPTGTTKFEKRNIAEYIPVWLPEVCIQCGDCSAVCPHAVIRLKMYDPKYLNDAPETFKNIDAKGKEFAGLKLTIQISPEDCTGCGACVNICPAFEKIDGVKTDRKAINMEPQPPLREMEKANWGYFLSIPDTDSSLIKRNTTKGTQLLRPLFEFSGACAGCGETPYVKLMSQLFGDRAIISNATGCSSIYGGNLPTTPYTTRPDGRGPAWSNSLFEDAAEFGLGMRLTTDKLTEYAKELLDREISQKNLGIASDLLMNIRENPQGEQEEIEKQRGWVTELKTQLEKKGSPEAKISLPLLIT